jgi:hypothetical protein
MEAWLAIYRLNAVAKDGRAIVVGVSQTASQAFITIRDMLAEYPRAWITDEFDADVSLPELMLRVEEEQTQPSKPHGGR